MTVNYLPKDEQALDEWFANWAAKATESGAAHGFSGDEIKQIQDDAVMVHNLVSGTATVETNRREFINFKRIMLYGAKNSATPVYPTTNAPAEPSLNLAMMAGIIQRTRSFVRRLKESANYNEAVGADYRVLPIQTPGRGIDEAQPKLKARAMAASEVDIEFARGEFDGVEIESQIGNSTNWNSLGRFYKSPAQDDSAPAAPNTPEVRRYRGRFLQGNKPIGIYSDIVSIVTVP
jgi:hypothetical protein